MHDLETRTNCLMLSFYLASSRACFALLSRPAHEWAQCVWLEKNERTGANSRISSMMELAGSFLMNMGAGSCIRIFAVYLDTYGYIKRAIEREVEGCLHIEVETCADLIIYTSVALYIYRCTCVSKLVRRHASIIHA